MARRRPVAAVVLALVFGLAAAAVTATSQNKTASRITTFTSPDGDFQFRYPAWLVRCENVGDVPGQWRPDSCLAYIPICPGTNPADTPIVCIGYPRERIQESTTFEGAAFGASFVKGADSQAKCLTIQRPAEGHTRLTNKSGVQFVVGEIGEAALGNDLEGYVYRTFHNDICYELTISIGYANAMDFDPPRPEFNRAPVRKALQQPLWTFEFLK